MLREEGERGREEKGKEIKRERGGGGGGKGEGFFLLHSIADITCSLYDLRHFPRASFIYSHGKP